jgi:integrase
MRDIMAGKTAAVVKTAKLRGKAVVRGGTGTATRTVGLFGGILTYAAEAGIIDTNPAHGIRKPKDNVRERRLNEDEYRTLGKILREAEADGQYAIAAEAIRMLALTGCRRSEIVSLRWREVDAPSSCLRLEDSKEGKAVRPIGLPVIEALHQRELSAIGTYLFPGCGEDNAFGGFANHWDKLFSNTPLADITAHILRHSFASVANDLGFTELTIAELMGHAKGSVTSKYVHTLDVTLVMAADTIAGYIQGLLDGIEYRQTAYALDHDLRRAALIKFLSDAAVPTNRVARIAA